MCTSPRTPSDPSLPNHSAPFSSTPAPSPHPLGPALLAPEMSARRRRSRKREGVRARCRCRCGRTSPPEAAPPARHPAAPPGDGMPTNPWVRCCCSAQACGRLRPVPAPRTRRRRRRHWPRRPGRRHHILRSRPLSPRRRLMEACRRPRRSASPKTRSTSLRLRRCRASSARLPGLPRLLQDDLRAGAHRLAGLRREDLGGRQRRWRPWRRLIIR